MAIQPTVGRQVYYFPSTTDNLGQQFSPLAATICWVHTERLVNVAILSHEGHTSGRINVLLLQPEDLMPDSTVSFCMWPPSVVAMAQKNPAST